MSISDSSQQLKRLLIVLAACPHDPTPPPVITQASKLNRGFSADRQISYMTWVAEGILSQDQPWQSWKPR